MRQHLNGGVSFEIGRNIFVSSKRFRRVYKIYSRVRKSHFAESALHLRVSASGGKGECRVFYNGEHLIKQGIPKKICIAKIFWEEEQQVYMSKRRIAARKNYLVATRRRGKTERRAAPFSKRRQTVGFSWKSRKIRDLFSRIFVNHLNTRTYNSVFPKARSRRSHSNP